MRVGVLSDTHGLLRPEVVASLEGTNLILHAGDVGKPNILQPLSAIAPTLAVRGNVDKGTWADELPKTLTQDIEGVRILMLHDLGTLGTLSPDVRVVISGHSHVPKIEERGGILFLNPGSCGPRRFKLPVSLGCLEVEGGEVRARLLTLDL